VTADDFAISVERLVNQIGHWEQSRWSTPGRADVVHGLLQRLADLAADAEGRPHRPVPRPSDLILPDQLRVLADDLVAARPPGSVLAHAASDVTTVRHAL
jgi:hypothetical protein